MALDHKAANAPPEQVSAETSGDDWEALRWRDAREIQALRDIVDVYRTGAAALAAEVSELRAEVQRLRGALRAGRVLRGSRQVEVPIELDEHAQDFVGAILLGELADLPAPNMEDLLLVAGELTADSVRRYATAENVKAVLRVERAPTSLRVEVQALGPEPEDGAIRGGGVVERLSERWGTEHVSSGPSAVWAQLTPAPAG